MELGLFPAKHRDRPGKFSPPLQAAFLGGGVGSVGGANAKRVAF